MRSGIKQRLRRHWSTGIPEFNTALADTQKYRLGAILSTHDPDSRFEKVHFVWQMVRTNHIPIENDQGKNRTINENQSHFALTFFVWWSATCTLSYHSNVYRMQKLLTTKKIEIYTHICKRNGTYSQHEKNILSNIACVPYYSLMFLIRVLKKVCFVWKWSERTTSQLKKVNFVANGRTTW